MRAVTRSRYGGVDVIEHRTVEVPSVGEHQVLVEVAAAGLDRGVWHLVTGKPYLMRLMGFGVLAPKVHGLGHDLAGRVVAVGDGVTTFVPGDEVFGIGKATFAELAVARADRLVRRPPGLGFEEAAAIPTSAATARDALRAGGVGTGQRVLVLGASGGVGIFAVQLARVAGAEVTGVASTAKLDLVRAAGAHDVLDYTRDDVTDSDRPYDVIVDTAGTTSVRRLRRALTPRGVVVLVGGEQGGAVFGGVAGSAGAALVSSLRRQKVRMLFSQPDEGDLDALRELAASGDLRPLVDRSFPLSRAADALRYMVEGRVRGKVVIVPDRVGADGAR